MSSSAVLTSVRRLRGLLAAQRGQDESDEQLLHAFLSRRDENAFAALVGRHGPMVLHVCRRVLGHPQDAEDAFQATFLTLARNASSLRKKTALASFLHGTAYRMALKAKQAAARRRKHEGQAPTRPPADPADELSWREVRMLLDEEIGRLPEKYRSVFILCCLEDLSRAEAGRRLGLKERTVLSRLAEARKRLQMRLSRRGVELTALLAATTLTTETASALPSVLLTKAIEGTVSPAATALAESAPSLLTIGKAKLAAVLLLAASMLSGAGLWAYRSPAASPAQPAEPPAAKVSGKPKADPPKREAAETVEIQGRVLGPDGKPVKGAQLYSPHVRKDPPNPLTDITLAQRGVSDADGRFRVEVLRSDVQVNWRSASLIIAAADGYGMDWAELPADDPRVPLTLRLVKDQVIQGRIVNTEGKPLAGARVRVLSLLAAPDGRLDAFLATWQGDWQWAFLQTPKHLHRPLDKVLHPVLTDKDGRFRIAGIGAERVAVLKVQGGGIATTSLHVIARAGFDPAAFKAGGRGKKADPLYGPSLECVASADRTIEGVVREAGSGKLIPGFTISAALGNNTEYAVSDSQGYYRLAGLARQEHYYLSARPPDNSSWLWSGTLVKDAEGVRPLKVDFTVERGVVVTGQIIDKKTGTGVPGAVSFAPLPDNKLAGKPGYNTFYHNHERTGTDADGRFRVVVIPGPLVLLARAAAVEKANGGQWINPYKQAEPDAADRKRVKVIVDGGGHRFIAVAGGGLEELTDYNAVKYLDLAPDAAAGKCSLSVDRGKTLTVKIEDDRGKPLKGTAVAGITESWPNERLIPEARVTIYALNPNKPGWLPFMHPKRQLAFLHYKCRLAGTLSVRGDEKEPPVARLVPTGTVTGRVLDHDGHPLAGADMEVTYASGDNRAAAQLQETFRRLEPPIRTDKDGRFRLENVIPGVKFGIWIRSGRTDLVGEPRIGVRQVKAGETLDLGDIRVKPAR